jgi:hypothetical protein
VTAIKAADEFDAAERPGIIVLPPMLLVPASLVGEVNDVNE